MDPVTKLSFPFTEQKIRALKVGDEVLISGVVSLDLPASYNGGKFRT